MSIKLFPAAVNPVDPPQAPDVSTSLVPLTQRAVATTPRATGTRQLTLVPSADAFTWSSSARRGGANRIYGTFVEDSQSVDDSQNDEMRGSGWEYVSGWASSYSAGRTAIANYLSYAADPAGWSGWLIDLYA